jgi:hypothetical protein
MPLTLLQKYEVLHKVRFVAANLKNFIEALDTLPELREKYGDDVIEFLDGVISVAEWQDSRDWAVARHGLLAQRVDAKFGDGLDALRDDERP